MVLDSIQQRKNSRIKVNYSVQTTKMDGTQGKWDRIPETKSISEINWGRKVNPLKVYDEELLARLQRWKSQGVSILLAINGNTYTRNISLQRSLEGEGIGLSDIMKENTQKYYHQRH